MRTTVFAGADAHAERTLATVGLEKAVLQAAVAQFAQLPLGMPPGIPALNQSVARAGASTPDHDCENEGADTNSSNDVAAKKNRYLRLQFILSGLQLQLWCCPKSSSATYDAPE
jgi:hypothetical protein